MVETVTIVKGNDYPTLEESARAMGIDPSTVDPTATSQTPPEKILGKFSSTEELAKAYKELESKLGQRADDASPLPSDVQSQEDGDEVEDEPSNTDEGKSEEDSKVEEELANRGLAFDEFASEYEKDGALSDGSYEKLEKAGIPRELVDEFIAGREAVLELTRQSVFSEVGGEKSYFDMIEWAGNNYTAEEIEAFNNAVDGADANARMMAVRGLKARYETTVGREPTNTIEGTRRSGGNVSVYRSIAEMQTDMADPRYKSDPAFRARVEAKLARSNIL